MAKKAGTPDTAMNDAGRVARFVDLFSGTRSEALIANLDTQVSAIRIGGIDWPVTVNDGARPPTCYICSPRAAYVDYALDETRNFNAHPLVRAMARIAIRLAAPLLDASGLDRQVQPNNWLFSTNPVPPIDTAAAQAMVSSLIPAHPDRAIVIRSLNPLADAGSMAALVAAGFRMIPARRIWLYDGASAPRSNNVDNDRRLAARTPHRLVRGNAITTADDKRIAELYAMLYLQKYTPLNPQYTPAFIRATRESGLIDYCGYRDQTGELVAIAGFFANGRTLTQPIVGYDTTRPASEGLYRLVMAEGQAIARAHGLFFNMSAGAGQFKRLRGARPVIEYSAVHACHLDRRRQRALRAIETLLVRIGIPLLEAYDL